MTHHRNDLRTERDDLAKRIADMQAAHVKGDVESLLRAAGGKVPLTALRERIQFLIARDVDRVAVLDAMIKRIEDLKRPPPPNAEIAVAVDELRRRKFRWPTHDELEREMGRALPATVMAYINSATTSSRFLN